MSHHPTSCSCDGPWWQTGQCPQGTKTISWSWDQGSSRPRIGRTDDSIRKTTCLPQYCSTNTESQKAKTQKQKEHAVDQFMLAALDRFKCLWQQQFFEGPAARRDFWEEQRPQWVSDWPAVRQAQYRWVQDAERPPSGHESGWSRDTSPGSSLPTRQHFHERFTR